MLRLYMMPVQDFGGMIGRAPKYYQSFTGPWGMTYYGARNVCLVASDTATATHSALIANADVLAFPDNFQTSGATLSGTTRTNFSNAIEAFGVPATWIANGNTYLSVAHTIGAMFQFVVRWSDLQGGTDPTVGVTLNSQIGNLQSPQSFYDAAASLGWSTTGITNTTTIRNALKAMADQWRARPIDLNSFII